LIDQEGLVERDVGADAADDELVERAPHAGDGFLPADQISDLVEYVTSISGRSADTAAAARAAPIFQKECSSCHGVDARGDRTKGSPNLTDADWLYGGDRASIRRTIFGPRNGIMPAWQERFDDATIRALAVYVHSLGGGE